MLKLLVTFVLTLLLNYSIYSQPCLPEGITFSTQEQIDNFQVNYPNCTEIEGFAVITGDDITNLNGLNVLISIGDDLLIINCISLQNLSGLDNLETIGSDLSLFGNSTLVSMESLMNLNSIAGNLTIGSIWNGGNPNLENLSGLDNITAINGDLFISNNSSLVHLSGLKSLESIGGSLGILEMKC